MPANDYDPIAEDRERLGILPPGDHLDPVDEVDAHPDLRPHGRWVFRRATMEYLVEVEGDRATLASRNMRDFNPVWGPPTYGEQR